MHRPHQTHPSPDSLRAGHRPQAIPLALLATLLSTLGASPALAGGPQIEQVLDAQDRPTTVVAPGAPLTLKGRELYAAPEGEEPKGFPGLSATLGGQPLLVLAASPEELRLLVSPDQPERKGQELVIRFRGQSARARLDVGPVAQGPEPGTAEPPPPFEITSFRQQTTGAGALFLAAGRAPGLPDGLKIQLALRYGADEVRVRSLPLRGGAFEATFGPFRERLPVGHYALELSFSLNRQSKSGYRSLQRSLPASLSRAEREATLERLKSVRVVAWLNVGGTGPGGQILPEDRAPQAEALRGRAEALAKACETLLARLEAAYALAARVHLRRGGELSQEAYLTWLVDQGHAADRSAAEALLADTRFASRRGELDSAAWGAWVEAELYPGLRAEAQAERSFAGETLCPLDPGAKRLATQALSELYALARERSASLFKAAGAPLPPALGSPDLGLTPAPRSSPKRLRATLGELRARVRGAQ